MLGTTREEVLNSAALAHAKYLLAGESVFDHGDPVDIEVDSPQYGPLREEIII